MYKLGNICAERGEGVGSGVGSKSREGEAVTITLSPLVFMM